MITKSPQLAEVTLSYRTKIKTSEMPKICGSEDAATILRAIWGETIQHVESCYVLLLNNDGRLIGFLKVAIGGINLVVVDRRVVFQAAILANATDIILAHNHPCGNHEPSPEDVEITNSLVEAGRLLNIQIKDHIIMTDEGYTSLLDNNLM